MLTKVIKLAKRRNNSNTTANPRHLADSKGKAYASSRAKTGVDSVDQLLDNTWVKTAFLINDDQLSTTMDITNRYWTSAETKFTDTRLGANIGINARPQFTPYADIPVKGKLTGRTDVSVQYTGGDYGMGAYYSEAIDDNSQTIYIRAGVPSFNSLLSFMTGAFDADLSSLVRTGRTKSAFYSVGKMVGTVAFVVAFPTLSAVMVANRLINTFFSRPTSKFYTMKPTMHLYWSSVNMLVNTIAINAGIMPRWMDDAVKDQKVGNPWKVDQEQLGVLHTLMPDVFTSQSGYDIFAMANKAQRIANQQMEDAYNSFNNGTSTDYLGLVQKAYQSKVTDPLGRKDGVTGLMNFIDHYLKFGYYTKEDTSSNTAEVTPKLDAAGNKIQTPPAGFGDYFDAEFRQGSQFAVFKVDHTGSVSESVSNSAVESDLSNKFNGLSSTMREARFSFAEGNVAPGGIGAAIETAMGAVKDVVEGTLDGVTGGIFGGLAGLAGGGFIDIPKHWQSSNVTLPRMSYSMTLIAPYGNIISRMQNIYIPLSMIMALAYPHTMGKQSYGSPFLVQVYDQGRCQCPMGLVESFTVTRGTSNLPFTNRGAVLAIEVQFSILDLSSIMHMPLSTGSLFGTDTTLDEDNLLMDYLAVLAGQDVYSQFYSIPKAKLALAKKFRQVEKLTSPAYWASFVHEKTTSGMLSYIVPGGLLEAALPGTAVLPGSTQRR